LHFLFYLWWCRRHRTHFYVCKK